MTIMRNSVLAFCIVAFITYSPADWAQQPSSSPEPEQQPIIPGVAGNATQKAPNVITIPTTDENPGLLRENYQIKQSLEFGGRITNYTGNTGTWDSFVNLG